MGKAYSSSPTLRVGWLFLAQSLVTALLVTWPIARQLEQTSLGSSSGDHTKHLWNFWWIRQSRISDPEFPLYTHLLNAPEGIPFWPIEPLHGLAALALPGLAIAPLSDLLALTNMTLIGVCTAYLVHALTRSVQAALASAFLFQVSSFPAFAIEVGVGELQHSWLLSLGALCLWRLRGRPSLARTLLAGGVLGITPMISFYMGLYTASTATVLALGWWWFGQSLRPNKRSLAFAAGIALVLAWIPVQVFSNTYGVSSTQDTSAFAVLLEGTADSQAVNPPETRLDPLELLVGEQVRSSDNPAQITYGAGRILGLPVLVLSILALIRLPRESAPWLLLAGVGVILAMGSYLSLGGTEFKIGSTRIALPFLYLNRLLTLVAEPVHFPARFLAVTQLSLAVVSGLGIATLSGRARHLGFALVALQFIDVRARGALPTPLSVTVQPDLSALATLRQHENHALLDLSMLWQSGTRNRSLALFAQTIHQHPVNTIALERIDQFASDGEYIACALDIAKSLHAAFVDLPIPGLDSLDIAPDLHFLSGRGFTELSLSLPAGSAPARLTQLLGLPLVETNSMIVWEIHSTAPAASDEVAWNARYEKRLAQLNQEGCLFSQGRPRGPPMDLTPKRTELDAVTLPEPPFLARTRQAPVSLVDSTGKLSFILDALAVQVEVLELNDAAARILCTGCRENAEGWIPRSQLLVTELGSDRTEDRLAAFLKQETQQIPVLQSGVTPSGAAWIAPPWAEEEDYSGESFFIRESGNGFVLEPRTPSGELSPGDDSEAGKIIDSK